MTTSVTSASEAAKIILCDEVELFLHFGQVFAMAELMTELKRQIRADEKNPLQGLLGESPCETTKTRTRDSLPRPKKAPRYDTRQLAANLCMSRRNAEYLMSSGAIPFVYAKGRGKRAKRYVDHADALGYVNAQRQASDQRPLKSGEWPLP